MLSRAARGTGSIFARTINVCWYLFKWGLLLAAIAIVAGGAWVYLHVNDEIRRHVEQTFARQYPHLEVSVRSARLEPGEGIEIRGLLIRDPAIAGAEGQLVYLDEVFVAGNVNLQALISGELDIRQVVIRRPTLRVARRPDGTWTTDQLLPIPKFGADSSLGPDSPRTTIEGGRVEIVDPTKRRPSTFVLRDVNLSLKPVGDGIAASPGGGAMRVDGSLGGDHLGRIELSGSFDPARDRWAVTGSTAGVRISRELREALPTELAGHVDVLRSLRGDAQCKFHVSFDPRAPTRYRFDVQGELSQGRLDDPRLPKAITDIHARVRCDNQGVTIDDLTATSGQATLKLSGRREGYGADGPLALKAEARSVTLDQVWLDLLPENMRTAWHKFLPAGEVDADLRLRFDGRRWKPELFVRCLDVSFSYYKFPYRLEHGTGTIELVGNAMTYRLRAYAAGQPVRINGDLKDPGPAFTGWTEIKAAGIPLDEKFFEALRGMPGKSYEVVRSLHPEGSIDVEGRIERRDPAQRVLDQKMWVGVDCRSLQYEKFPYPFKEVRGTLELAGGQWTIRDFSGRNDTGQVTCWGYVRTPRDGGQLELHFTGRKVPLEEELRDALTAPAKKLWQQFDVRGTVDLTVDMFYQPGPRQLSLLVNAEPVGTASSIRPAFFPYRMTLVERNPHVAGLVDRMPRQRAGETAAPPSRVVTYRDGVFLPRGEDLPGDVKCVVDLHDLAARHGATNLRTSGRCIARRDGSWHVRLGNLSADRVRLDRDQQLVAALPDGLRGAVESLRPTGAMNLRGAIEFAGRQAAGARVTSQWDLALDVHQGTLDCGVLLENLHGGVRLRGGYDGRQFQTSGRLDVDSASYEDFQFTHVRGPLSINNTQAVFGEWDRPPAAGRSAEPVTARIFGGAVTGDLWVQLDAAPRFALRAKLADGDLARLAQEHIPGESRLKGKMYGTIELGGTAGGVNSLDGRGHVALRNADIYELPQMVALLKILRVRPPDKTAFTKSDITFSIKANHVYFQPIEFSGHAVSLHGKGEMDLDRNLNLTFSSTVGPGELQLPLVKNIVGKASEQFMLIHVGGTLDDPRIRQEPFPNLNRALTGEQENSTAPPSILSPALEVLRSVSPLKARK